MKALIISDTHGLTEEVALVAQREKFEKGFHCGDFCTDPSQSPFNTFVMVRGNNDDHPKVANEELVQWAGLNILVTHGHLYQVEYSLLRLGYRAMEAEADVVLFGHTHYPVCLEQDGIIFCNPGSLKRPRGYTIPTYVTLEVTEQKEQLALSFTYYDRQGHRVEALGRSFLRSRAKD